MKTSKIKFLPSILAASVLSLTSCEKDDMMENPTSSTETMNNASSVNSGGKYLVTLKDGATLNESQVSTILGKVGMINKSFGKLQGKAFTGLSMELSAEELENLRKNENVALIEPDQIFSLGGKPVKDSGSTKGGGKKNNDTSTTTGTSGTTTTTTTTTTSTTTPSTSTGSYVITPLAGQSLSWGATNVGIGDGAATGRTAWIIDSGIQLNHPDLNVDAARSRSFISSTTSPDDQFGHGTKVAGIIGAKNNGYGVVGIASGASLVSLRVMDASGSGTVSSVISALNYVAANGQPGDVVNLSLGASPSTTLDNAVLAVANLGIFVTIAAGNSSANAANYSPARVNHSNVFTVSGMRSDQTFMGMSNWGTPVDYCAPGNSISTTTMGSTYALNNCHGTSMAAPHVAGILLIRGNVAGSSFVTGDPDGNADKMATL